ncbi:hypothetical protein GCM10010195_19460 [Kitasatospora griseola]|nr:hypothetical protein GCM10010195_19460 [Kitasatospora griseola]
MLRTRSAGPMPRVWRTGTRRRRVVIVSYGRAAVPASAAARLVKAMDRSAGVAPGAPPRNRTGLSESSVSPGPAARLQGCGVIPQAFGTRVFSLVRPAAKSSMLRAVASMIWPTAVWVK